MDTHATNPVPEEWKSLYEAAVLELDQTRLRERITTAEKAVKTRLKLLRTFADRAEKNVLESALIFLRDLRRIEKIDNEHA